MVKLSRLALLLSLALSVNAPSAGQDPPQAPEASNPSPAVVQPAQEQSGKSKGPSGSQSLNAEAEACKVGDEVDFIYPPVDASYIGGTISGMPLTKDKLSRLNPFQVRQFRVNGQLAMGQCDMVFVFGDSAKLQGKPVEPQRESGASFELLSCGQDSPRLSGALTKLCGRMKHGHIVKIPYKPINVLSRARKISGELNTETATYLTAASAILTAVLGGATGNRDKLIYGGSTVLAATAAYFFLVARPSQRENYMAVFLEKKDSEAKNNPPPSPEPEKTSEGGSSVIVHANGSVYGLSQQPKPAADEELFKKGDVLMFRINNFHDYYNISMILNGKTGHQFVSENAEKGAK